MIATIRFKLPDENEEFQTAIKAGAYASAISDITEKIRSKMKYCELSEEAAGAYEEMWEALWDIRSKFGVEE